MYNNKFNYTENPNDIYDGNETKPTVKIFFEKLQRDKILMNILQNIDNEVEKYQIFIGLSKLIGLPLNRLPQLIQRMKKISQIQNITETKKNLNMERKNKKLLNENYENLPNPVKQQIEQELHHYKNHPVLTKDVLRELLAQRYEELREQYKDTFDVEDVDFHHYIENFQRLYYDTVSLEQNYKTELEKLAIKLVKREFKIPDGSINFEAKLTTRVNFSFDQYHSKFNIDDADIDEFENIEELEQLRDEIDKRNLLNMLTQGASMRVNHIFHLVRRDLNQINPNLLSRYKKLMNIGDIGYFFFNNVSGPTGGFNKVIPPENDDEPYTIYAEAVTFPVLVHELTKGIYELLSWNGLSSNKRIQRKVIESEATVNEIMDSRIGPMVWSKILNLIPLEYFDKETYDIKMLLYYELAKLTPSKLREFINEVLQGTSKGKNWVLTIVKDIDKRERLKEMEKALEKRKQQYIDDEYTNDDADLNF